MRRTPGSCANAFFLSLPLVPATLRAPGAYLPYIHNIHTIRTVQHCTSEAACPGTCREAGIGRGGGNLFLRCPPDRAEGPKGGARMKRCVLALLVVGLVAALAGG